MFGFKSAAQTELRSTLSKHLQRDSLQRFRYGKRNEARGSYCRPVWIIPMEGHKVFINETTAGLTRDISIQGLSLISNQLPETARLIVGLGSQGEYDFIECELEHCTELGLGFYQIGLRPTRVCLLSSQHLDEIRLREQQETRPVGEAVAFL